MEQNLENHSLKLKINHRVFEVKRKYALLELISELGLDNPKVKRLKELSSPMPGRVLKIMVKVGDEINIGDSLLSLEAMKMENILKSDGEGVVKEIFISEQQIVDKGEVLIEFE
jgi:biotin carboxyl carrier protein